MNRKRFLFINVALLAVAVCLCWSCYKITLVVQAHSIVRGNVFNGKLVIKDTNNTAGGMEHVYGLFGIRVPEGWEVDGHIVMTQVAKATTDTGDPDYNQTITRSLETSQAYTDLLNRCYPRNGYTWLGFVTSSDFKTLLSGNDAAKRVDSIYVDFTIATSSDKTGVYYLDYAQYIALFEPVAQKERLHTFENAGDRVARGSYVPRHDLEPHLARVDQAREDKAERFLVGISFDQKKYDFLSL